MWPFSTSATRVSRPAALIKRMLPMGEPRARASGLAVRRTGGGGIERFRKAREESVLSRTHGRRPAAAMAVLGPWAQGVHESQDSLEVLRCCSCGQWVPVGFAAMLAAPGAERRCLFEALRGRRSRQKSLSTHIFAEKGGCAKGNRHPPARTTARPFNSAP